MKNKSLAELAARPQQRQQPTQQANQQQQGPKENPEVNAKIDAFIAENAKYIEYLKTLSQERLIRTIALSKVVEQERKEFLQQKTMEKLQNWVNERPDVKQRIEQRLQNVAAEKQPGAYVNLVRREQMRVGAQMPANGVKPSM